MEIEDPSEEAGGFTIFSGVCRRGGTLQKPEARCSGDSSQIDEGYILRW